MTNFEVSNTHNVSREFPPRHHLLLLLRDAGLDAFSGFP